MVCTTHSPIGNDYTHSHLLFGMPDEVFLGPGPHPPYLFHLLVQSHVALVQELGRFAVVGLTGQTGQPAVMEGRCEDQLLPWQQRAV